MSIETDEFGDLEDQLRSAFGQLRGAGAPTIDLVPVTRRVVAAQRRQRALAIGTAAASVLLVIVAAVGFGALRDRAQPAPLVPATSASTAHTATATSVAPTFAGGALVPGLAPPNREIFPGDVRTTPLKVNGSVSASSWSLGFCTTGPDLPKEALGENWTDVDGVMGGGVAILRMRTESAATRLLQTCLGAGKATSVPGSAFTVVEGLDNPIPPTSFAGAAHGAYLVFVWHNGDSAPAVSIGEGILARLTGRAPLTPAAQLAPPPPPTQTKTGIPFSIADGIPGRDSANSIQLTGERQPWVMNLQVCDPAVSGADLGQVISGIDGYSIGYPVTATVTRLAPGQGPAAWQQLLADRGECRWSAAPTISGWAGHPDGRVIDAGNGLAVTQQVGDFIVSTSQLKDARTTRADLQRLNDVVVANLRNAGLVG